MCHLVSYQENGNLAQHVKKVSWQRIHLQTKLLVTLIVMNMFLYLLAVTDLLSPYEYTYKLLLEISGPSAQYLYFLLTTDSSLRMMEKLLLLLPKIAINSMCGIRSKFKKLIKETKCIDQIKKQALEKEEKETKELFLGTS